MPSEGLRLGRDSGSVLCDTLKKWPFRTAWGKMQENPQKFCRLGFICYFCRGIINKFLKLQITNGIN